MHIFTFIKRVLAFIKSKSVFGKLLVFAFAFARLGAKQSSGAQARPRDSNDIDGPHADPCVFERNALHGFGGNALGVHSRVRR